MVLAHPTQNIALTNWCTCVGFSLGTFIMFVFVIVFHRVCSLILVWHHQPLKLDINAGDIRSISFSPRILHHDTVVFKTPDSQGGIVCDERGKACVQFDDVQKLQGNLVSDWAIVK